MLITTGFDLPGYEITSVQGEIFGLTVRSRNIGAGCIAGLRSIGGGEIPEFTKLLSQSRSEAMARMVEEARRLGSTAIIGMRFDSGAIGQWSEICAYGTGVTVNPVTEYARQQFEHILATGGIAMTDDLLGQFLGQDLLRRLSRRLGEGAFNGALTARIGVAAIDVIRPLPFITAKPPRVRDILGEVLKPMFGKGSPPGA